MHRARAGISAAAHGSKFDGVVVGRTAERQGVPFGVEARPVGRGQWHGTQSAGLRTPRPLGRRGAAAAKVQNEKCTEDRVLSVGNESIDLMCPARSLCARQAAISPAPSPLP